MTLQGNNLMYLEQGYMCLEYNVPNIMSYMTLKAEHWCRYEFVVFYKSLSRKPDPDGSFLNSDIDVYK